MYKSKQSLIGLACLAVCGIAAATSSIDDRVGIYLDSKCSDNSAVSPYSQQVQISVPTICYISTGGCNYQFGWDGPYGGTTTTNFNVDSIEIREMNGDNTNTPSYHPKFTFNPYMPAGVSAVVYQGNNTTYDPGRMQISTSGCQAGNCTFNEISASNELKQDAVVFNGVSGTNYGGARDAISISFLATRTNWVTATMTYSCVESGSTVVTTIPFLIHVLP